MNAISPVGTFGPARTLKSFGGRANESAGPRALTVGDVGALSDFDNITVRIADIAAYLAVLGYRFRDELRSSTFP